MDLEFAKSVLRAEADAVLSLLPRLGPSFLKTAQLILESKGRVVVTGMGKAGLVGQKISATLASTSLWRTWRWSRPCTSALPTGWSTIWPPG